MRLTDKQLGNLTMFCVVSFFAINIPVSKFMLANGSISPYGLTIARMAFASIAFWTTSLFMKRERVTTRDLLTLFAGGLLGIIFNQGLFVWGLSQTSPVDASIITTCTPLFAMIIAAIVLREPITTKKVSGVVVGGIGAIFLVLTAHNGTSAGDPSLRGNIAVACSSLSYATYLVVTRHLSSRYSSVTIMKWMFLFSTVILLPLFYKDLVYAPLFHQTEARPYLMIGYTLFFATFIPYMLIPIAQKKIRPTTISMYNNLQPLMASMIAIFMGQDTFSVEKVISGILILLGVYLVTSSKSKSDLEQAAPKR